MHTEVIMSTKFNLSFLSSTFAALKFSTEEIKKAMDVDTKTVKEGDE